MKTQILELVCVLLGFALGYVVARRRKVQVVRMDADVKLLDDVLKLDRALYHEHDWLDHKRDDSPHVGLWFYRGDDGRVHVDNRHHGNTNDDNRELGGTAGEALLVLWNTLKRRADARRRALNEAEHGR